MKKVLIIFLFLCSILFLANHFVLANEPVYQIHPEDVIRVTVYGQPDLTTVARVNNDGDITIPLLKIVHVADLSTTDAEELIRSLLAKDYLVDPHVQVFVKEYHKDQITVLGAVKKPGKYLMNLTRSTTLLEAIAMAEGFSDIADINSTRVIRRDKESHKEKVIYVKVTEITKKGNVDANIALQSGDVVFVPESFF